MSKNKETIHILEHPIYIIYRGLFFSPLYIILSLAIYCIFHFISHPSPLLVLNLTLVAFFILTPRKLYSITNQHIHCVYLFLDDCAKVCRSKYTLDESRGVILNIHDVNCIDLQYKLLYTKVVIQYNDNNHLIIPTCMSRRKSIQTQCLLKNIVENRVNF